MYKDEIITEVWHNRDEYARKHHYNLDEIVADLLIREQTHPDRIIQTTTNRTKGCTRHKNSRVTAVFC
jgi:hypothetical protein